MALNTIVQLKLPNGDEVNLADWSDRPLYSSADLGSGYADQEVDLFQYTAGQAVPGAAPSLGLSLRSSTQNDTNLANAGEMATTEEMLVYAIKPEVYLYSWDGSDFNTRTYLGAGTRGYPNTTFSAIGVFMSQLLIRLRVTEKDYCQSGFGYFVPGFGPFGTSSMVPGQAAAASQHFANNGLPSQEAVRALSIPVHIGGQEKYRLTLVNDTGNPVAFGKNEAEPCVDNPTIMATVRASLDGLYKRPVA
jgi:hypothetical protein